MLGMISDMPTEPDQDHQKRPILETQISSGDVETALAVSCWGRCVETVRSASLPRGPGQEEKVGHAQLSLGWTAGSELGVFSAWE